MFEHNITDCTNCKYSDYLLKDGNDCVCLNCGHMSKIPSSKSDTQDNSNVFSTLVGVNSCYRG
jgi:hypothetical protein